MSNASVAACSLSHTGKAATSKARPAGVSLRRRLPFVRIVDRYRDETSALERLQVGGQRRAVHREHSRNVADARRFGAVERHQQRKLAIGEPERPQRRIKTARQRPRRLLKVETQAGITNPARDIEPQLAIAC